MKEKDCAESDLCCTAFGDERPWQDMAFVPNWEQRDTAVPVGRIWYPSFHCIYPERETIAECIWAYIHRQKI